ncbi:hypothetical protein RhiirC2_103133 [Rhizophagus irregularis]|uniref:Uncharacterized protein n=1 Tax=Rhizophagus irregularis TaxID=588596 RepID=A0A2N1NTG9_9GLOM|nr:hypothetical protein RhiirC2_103133 [Rhizophagus irregularis]
MFLSYFPVKQNLYQQKIFYPIIQLTILNYYNIFCFFFRCTWLSTKCHVHKVCPKRD